MNHSSYNHSLDFLFELLSKPSPVGYEFQAQECWTSYLKPICNNIEIDHYGSAVAFLNINKHYPTIMIEAHIDEIGMVIQHIDEQGFIYVNRLGGSDPSIAKAKRVTIHSQQGDIYGIIGNTAIHLQDRSNKSNPVRWCDIFIDIGVTSKEEALNFVQIGDPITYQVDPIWLRNKELLTARALDNRIGSYIIAQVMTELSTEKDRLKINLAAVNSTQEEVGGHGAHMMTTKVKPKFAFITDVTHATDTPGIDYRKHGKVLLKQGATIHHGGPNHPALVSYLKEISVRHNIPIQHESTSSRTFTDTDQVFIQYGGIPCALVSTPLRYMHSPVEIISMSDVKHVINLFKQAILSFNPEKLFSQ